MRVPTSEEIFGSLKQEIETLKAREYIPARTIQTGIDADGRSYWRAELWRDDKRIAITGDYYNPVYPDEVKQLSARAQPAEAVRVAAQALIDDMQPQHWERSETSMSVKLLADLRRALSAPSPDAPAPEAKAWRDESALNLSTQASLLLCSVIRSFSSQSISSRIACNNSQASLRWLTSQSGSLIRYSRSDFCCSVSIAFILDLVMFVIAIVSFGVG